MQIFYSQTSPNQNISWRIILLRYFICILLCLSVINFINSRKVEAVNNNTRGIISGIPANMISMGQTTNPNWSSGKTCNGFNNAQYPWLSTRGDTLATSATVASGTNSVSLQFNAVGATCDSVIETNGIIKDVGKTIKVTRWRVTGSSSSYGSISGLTWSYMDVDYRPSHQANNRYTGIRNIPFTLNGLSSLAPGTHNITVSVSVRPINEFTPGSYYGQTYGCVVNASPTPNGLDASECPSTSMNINIRITVLRPSNCTISGPTSVRPGENFSLRFSVFNGGNIPGAPSWNTMQFRLGTSAPVRDADAFGVGGNGNRVNIMNSHPEYTLLEVNKTSVTTATFTAPASSSTQQWALVNDTNGSPGYGWHGSVMCSFTINVISPLP